MEKHDVQRVREREREKERRLKKTKQDKTI